MIEWPPGSGRTAWYTPAELALVRAEVQAHEDGKITPVELANSLGFVHDLKVELDAKLVEPPPSTGSPFRIPAVPAALLAEET